MSRKKGWKEIPIGGLIGESGTAKEYKIGDWRTFKPVVDKQKCINCLQCWIYCPDSCIKVEDEKMAGFDYEHCKGCGICASICPVKCINMEKD
jgi:pyruvate ferredoxin oxidoreductase delta subunit